MQSNTSELAPIAIGGIGGSGTRVLARALRMAGVHTGDDINESLDTLWFTLLFKDRRILRASQSDFDRRLAVFLAAMRQGVVSDNPPPELIDGDRPGNGAVQHDEIWLKERLESLTCAIAQNSNSTAAGLRRWGWKEPNTHIVLDRLAGALPDLKYVHMVRNGLDMAWSANQNQLRFWGYAFLDPCSEREPEVTPRNSLAYWRRAQERIEQIGHAMGDRFFTLRYEDLCAEPQHELGRLMKFCELPVDRSLLNTIAASVHSPDSIGRYRNHPMDVFSLEDVDYVRKLGYPV